MAGSTATIPVIAVLLLAVGVYGQEPRSVPLLMPGVVPTKNETYVCTAFHTPRDDFEFIVGFEPHSPTHAAHHILLYGCVDGPGYVERDTPRAVWDCGGMEHGRSEFPPAPTCQGTSQIIYAWAHEALPLKLPQGVGFQVGKGSIRYLVVQIHYANVNMIDSNGADQSGVILQTLPSNTEQVTKLAGVLLLGTGGMIPRHSVEYMETACAIEDSVEFHPFAFRTHTHKLGTVVSGYLVTPDNHWERIGKKDPQKPQMFYPVGKDIAIRRGDVVAARCTMNNTRSRDVYIGATADDEMCNFYIMYYVERGHLSNKFCFSAGPPLYRWGADRQLRYVPRWVDRDASSLVDY